MASLAAIASTLLVTAGPSAAADPPGALVAVTGPAVDLGPVAARPPSPLADLERDCGLSAPMPDGSVLWVFCDTSDDDPQTFRTSTAAVAPQSDPTHVREPVDARGEPFEFVPHTPDEIAFGQRFGGYIGLWPSSIVADAGGLVTVFYERWHVAGFLDFRYLGAGIARLQWRPEMASGQVPLVATRVADDVLGPAPAAPVYGQAAVQVEGTITVFGCTQADAGRCRLARVPSSAVTSASAWRFWNGSAWVAGAGNAVPIDLPGIVDPIGQASVTWLASMQVWAMSYSPWPGFTNRASVRFASQLTGPWSEDTTFPVPGCEGDFENSCYAAVVHDELSGGGHLGLTVFDRGVRRLRAVSVPATPRPSTFTPVTPTRVADTRLGQPVGRLGPGGVASVVVAGRAGVPADATAVVLNVTAVWPIDTSYLTVWPANTQRPWASNLNPRTFVTNATMVTTALGPDGRVAVFNGNGSTDVVVDVVGWYGRGDGLGYSAILPERVADTRLDDPVPRLGPGTTATVAITGRSAVPDDATAVVVNVTAVGPADPGHLTAWPAGTPRPLASNLNPRAGETEPNLVTVGLGAGGAISIHNSAGSVDVVVDVVGWYGPGGEGALVPTRPARLVDTRDAQSPRLGWLESRQFGAIGRHDVPASALALATSVTAVAPTAESFLTVWPAGAVRPFASALNPLPLVTDPNAVLVGLGREGAFEVYNHAGTTDVVVDVAGWFVPVPPATS